MNDEIESKNNALFDIISSLQEKLSLTSNCPKSIEESSSINTGISGIAGNNIIELLKTIGKQKNEFEQKASFVDNSLTGTNSPNLSIDPSTIMNLQKLFSNNTPSDPRKNLLYALKPFLRETRQKNIDTYVTMLGVINALNIFSNRGSD